MRPVAEIVVAAAVMYGALASPATAAARQCPSRATARNGLLSVFRGTDAVAYATRATGNSYVCDRRSGRRTALESQLFGANSGSAVSRRSVAIAGPYVAWEYQAIDGNVFYSGLELVNARTGKQTLIEQIDVTNRLPGPLHYLRLALRSSGALAWSTTDGISACVHCQQVTGDPPRPAIHRLASAHGLAPRTLRTTPQGITWTQNGHAVHKRLN